MLIRIFRSLPIISIFSLICTLTVCYRIHADTIQQNGDNAKIQSINQVFLSSDGRIYPPTKEPAIVIDASENQLCETTYSIINNGPNPVTILEMIPSCHCTSASVVSPADGHEIKFAADTKSSKTNQIILSTGQKIDVHIQINLDDNKPGTYSKNLLVLTNPKQPKSVYLVVRYQIRDTMPQN